MADTKTYRCPGCSQLVEPIREGDHLVSYCCDEVVVRVWLCETCGERAQHRGCDECLPCICDSVIADPRELEMCTAAMQADIAKALAERLKPFLRQRQAA